MKTLIVIPARGGSKGIPHKNIAVINGKPMLEYTIEAAINANIKDAVISVSTDDAMIAEVAARYEQILVINRPVEISDDKAKIEAVLIHAAQVYEDKYGYRCDIIILLQPTSPLRKPETIKNFVKVYLENIKVFDAMLTLHENKEDHWVRTNTGFQRLYPNAPRRRQDREPLYVENSSIYGVTLNALEKTGSVLGKNVTGYIIDQEESIDINEPFDLRLTQAMMKGQG